MFALEPGRLGPQLLALGESVAGSLAAIVIVSAHWQTPELRVMSTPQPQTIHDFGGFPQQLYQIRYPAIGTPQFSQSTRQLLEAIGLTVLMDDRRGLDHGAWVPLRYLAPSGSVPVFQVSLTDDLSCAGAIEIGRALSKLRTQGVMVVGSGSLTHNLHEYFRGLTDNAYAIQFVDWVRTQLEGRAQSHLVHYREQAPHALRAHPTEEHFLPLLVAFGASLAADRFSVLQGGMDRALSMDSYVWSASAA